MSEEEKKNQSEEQDVASEESVAAENTQEKEATAEKTVEDQLAESLKEIENLNDKLLRARAEFDNYRKRTLKEKTELILNGGAGVMTSLLPVLDDLDRALLNMEKSDDVATLKEGVELIISKMSKTLSSQGLEKMETIGKDFNTDFHEAIAMVPCQEDEQKNKIVDCVQPGYMLNEKVIRHAKVVVAQ